MVESRHMNIDIKDVNINKSELAQRLKTPVVFEHEIVSECEEIIRKICKPGCCISEIEIKTEAPDAVFLDGFKVVSKDLFKNLQGCTSAYLKKTDLKTVWIPSMFHVKQIARGRSGA